MAYMIYEYFRATGAHEAAQGLSTLFAVSSQNDDVQDFDVKWDDALLSLSEMPSDTRIVQVRIREFCSTTDSDGFV